MSWFRPSDDIDRSYWNDGFVQGFLVGIMCLILAVSGVLIFTTDIFK